ncbi:hypothetical protein PHJA_002639800 [Phtheirospermum japonicum]|uniref:Uncharacterized protein n=1 Tax=Phtheirospermum japonicum TaxID=374723 RepID=A0A830D025_9LAMI|nr:hypothetical protein PHJA_002639800 [Phtheirospermum japonicum]
MLNINPSIFSTSNNRGTIIDSGTMLAYFAEVAYDPFVAAMTQCVSQSVRPLLSKGNQCYLKTSRFFIGLYICIILICVSFIGKITSS